MPLVVGVHGTPDTGSEACVDYIASGAIFCRLVTFDRQGYRAGSVCLNSFGRFAKWISATDYAAAITGVSALK